MFFEITQEKGLGIVTALGKNLLQTFVGGQYQVRCVHKSHFPNGIGDGFACMLFEIGA